MAVDFLPRCFFTVRSRILFKMTLGGAKQEKEKYCSPCIPEMYDYAELFYSFRIGIITFMAQFFLV